MYEGLLMSLIALVRRHPRLTLLLSLIVVVIVFWTQAGTKPVATTTAEDNKATLSVTVTRPRVQQWPLQVRANGNITAWQEALTSSPTFARRVSGGGFPLLGDSCSRSTWFLLHRAA